MRENLIFDWFPANMVYITTDFKRPYKNELELYVMNASEDDDISFKNQFKLTKEDELPGIHETESRPEWSGLSRIYVRFYWGTGEGCLCSEELGSAIVPSWVKGEHQWDIKLMPDGYFILIPSRTVLLKKKYSISFLLENLISDAIAGLTVAKIYIQNVPGYEDCEYTLPLHKQEPLEIIMFQADDSLIGKGKTTTLRWEVRNAQECMLTGFGQVEEKGSREVSLRSSDRFLLKASNKLGQHASACVCINVSEGQWKEEQHCKELLLPEKDTASSWNRELLSCGEKLYAFSDSVLYEAKDGAEFKVLSDQAGAWRAYGTAGYKDSLWLFGTDTLMGTGVLVCWQAGEARISQWGYPFLLDGQTAVLRAGDSVWVCVLPDSSHKAELYRKGDFPDGRWQLMAVLETDDAYLVKLAEWEDAVWAAVGTEKKILLFGTDNGIDWTWKYEVENPKEKEYFWLLSRKDGLFLIMRDGIYAKRGSGGFAKESVLPEKLSWTEERHACAGIFKEKLWLISPEEGGRSVWSYT